MLGQEPQQNTSSVSSNACGVQLPINQSHGLGIQSYSQSMVDGSTTNSETSATSHARSSILNIVNEKLLNFYLSAKSSEATVWKYERMLIYMFYIYMYYVNLIFPTISSDTRYGISKQHINGPYGFYSGWVFKVLNYPITFSLDEIDYNATVILTCILSTLYGVFFGLLVYESRTLKGKSHTRIRNLRQRVGALCATFSPLTLFMMSHFIHCNTSDKVISEKEHGLVYMLARNDSITCYGDPNLILFIVVCCIAPLVIIITAGSLLFMPNNGHSSLPFTSVDNVPVMVTVASIGLEIFIIFLIPSNLIFIRGIIHMLSCIFQIVLVVKMVPLMNRKYNSVYISALFGRLGASIGVFINQLVFVYHKDFSEEYSLGLMGLTMGLIILGSIFGGVGMEIYTRVACHRVRKILSAGFLNSMEKEAIAIYMEQESLRNLNLFLRFAGESQDDLSVALIFIKLIVANKVVQSPEILLSSAMLIAYHWVDENRSSFSTFILKRALRFVENPWTRTLIYERMKEIEIGNSNANNGINQVEIKAMLIDIEKKEEELWAVHRMFWKEVLSDLPNVKKITELNSKAASLTVYCDKLFNHLMTNFKHDKTVLRFYASYLENFKFDKETATLLFEQAFQMEEEESRTRVHPQFVEKRFKNKVSPYFNTTPNNPANVLDIRKNSITMIEENEGEEYFDGIENVETIDKKQVFFRNSLNTPYHSKGRNMFLIGLSVLTIMMLLVAFILCLIFGGVVTEIPLTLQSCLPGTTPNGLIREVRIGQIHNELYINQQWPKPSINTSEESVLNYFTTNHKKRFSRHLEFLQQLADNSMTSKYTDQMFRDYTANDNPIVIPIASVDRSTITYLTGYRKNVSMNELTQEFISLTKSFVEWGPKEYNETITSYLFMYLFLNRRTAAEAYSLFCSRFQESKRMQNAEIDLTLRYYLFISTGVLIIIYSIFLIITRIEMRNSTLVINLFKRIPKDLVGVIYQDLQKKTNQEAKHLGGIMNPKWVSVLVGILVLISFSLFISLMYLENNLNVETASQTMVNIDTATAVMRASNRLTVRLSELYAFLGIRPGKSVNHPSVGASLLNTYRVDNREYISEIQSSFTELLYGSDITKPLIGKYSRVDEIITSPLTCSFNGTCYRLQELVAIVTHAGARFNEDIWNPFFAARQDTFISYLELFNLADELVNRLAELLNSLAANTSNSSKAISIVFLIVGLITLPIYHYILYMNFQKSDNEITMLRSFLNYIPIDHFDTDDTLKNFALYNTLTKHTSKRKKVDTNDSIRNLLNSMVEGAVLCNERGEITLFNNAAQKMFGKSSTDVIGLPCIVLFDELFHDLIKRVTNQIIHSSENLLGEVLEIDCIRRNQTKFPAQISIFGTEVSGSTIISLLIKDITTEKKQNSLLAEEKKNSENLLRNILPDAVATKLKNGETFIAEKFSDITCFFSDMVGFTKLSSNMNPHQLVLMLNSIVNGFDDLTDRYSLEKIKTIGDAYFCVGGLHGNNAQSDHPERCVKFSIDTLSVIRSYNNENPSSQVNIRIGLNTGGVVAGVIGRKKFAYDLWGDTINLSSRMESTGVAGRIQLSRSTYERTYDVFEFEERSVEVKGKGVCQTYLLKEKHHVNPIVVTESSEPQQETNEENDIEVEMKASVVQSQHSEEKDLKQEYCSDLSVDYMNCNMSSNCTLGNIYTTSCSTNLTNCDGSTSFDKTYFCKYCWQLTENVHYTCDYRPSQSGLQSGQDTIIVTCSVNRNVLCLGKRSFSKISQVNYSTGKKWSSAFVFSLFLSGFSADRFYLGHAGWGVFKLFTLGGVGLWAIVDLVLDINIDSTQLRPSSIDLIFAKTRISNVDFDEWIHGNAKNVFTIYNVIVEPCIDGDPIDSHQDSHHPYCLVADKNTVIMTNGKQVELESVSASDAVRKRKKTDYVYTKLSDIQEGNHNIYGIVYDYKTMRQTENKAYSLTLKIIDDTCQDPNSKTDSLLITINHTNQKNLINCKYVGSIFRCHRFIVKNSRYGYQANVGPGFDYFFLSNDINESIPDELLSRKTFTDEDIERIKELKTFSRKFFSQDYSSVEKLPFVIADQKYLTTFSEAKEKATKMTVSFFVDVICKISFLNEDESSISLIANEGGKNLSSNVSIKSIELTDYIMKEVRSLFNGRDVWVKLRNAQCPPISEWGDEFVIPLRIFNGSIVILSDDHFYVKRCIERADNKPLENLITKVDFSQANLTPISDIVNTNNVPYKYRTRGKIIDYFPKNIEHFTKPNKKNSTQEEYRFLFQFLIKDLESGCCLTCFALDKEAEYLLQMPACNLKENTTSRRILEEKINQLVNPDHIIEICLVSYRVGNEKRFNMFGTTMLAD